MTPRIMRLLLLPLAAGLYVVHPLLGFIGLAAGFMAVFLARRTRDVMPSVVR
jgi:hypothetical protein